MQKFVLNNLLTPHPQTQLNLLHNWTMVEFGYVLLAFFFKMWRRLLFLLIFSLTLTYASLSFGPRELAWVIKDWERWWEIPSSISYGDKNLVLKEMAFVFLIKSNVMFLVRINTVVTFNVQTPLNEFLGWKKFFICVGGSDWLKNLTSLYKSILFLTIRLLMHFFIVNSMKLL